MAKERLSAHQLTDEEVLKEFVSRFQCDGAVLLYLDNEVESGFGRWRTREGRQWVREIMRTVNPSDVANEMIAKARNGVTLPATSIP
ncbi:MAG: hypothetical protein ACN4EP_10800 [Sediminibacterium sp.]